MSIWTFAHNDPPEEYEAKNAARVAVFNKIAPRDNWKNPILRWIKESEFEECNEAAIWFTGAGLTIIDRKEYANGVLVEGPGYYATIGA